MSSPAPPDLRRFESLGDNCEFGFALQALGRPGSGLFHWTFLEAASLLRLLRAGFAGFYDLPCLQPAHGSMVLDTRYGIGWHTGMRSEPGEGGMRFLADPPTLAALHAGEAAKRDHQRRQFVARLRTGGAIYAIKANAGIAPDLPDGIEAELARLAEGAPFWIMELRAAGPGEAAGGMRVAGPGRLVGTVARFARYHLANDFDLGCYQRLLARALELVPCPGGAEALAAAVRESLPGPSTALPA